MINEKTRNFLKCCRKCGIRRVAIGCRDNKIKESMLWRYGDRSAFAEGKYDGWPAIWHAVRLAGISAGCGNHNQHQVYMDDIEPGVYVCDRRWRKESDGV